MTKKVSVLIPVKNCELTIEKSINSVLKQSFQNFEIVLIDNNCTDKTVELAQDLAKDKLKVFSCPEPGIVPALNFGLQKIQTDFIARQDGDDVWYPQKLEEQISFLDNNEDIDICGTQIRLVNSEGEIIDDSFRYPTNDQEIKSWLLMGKNSIAHPSVVFRKSILLRVGGYDDTYPIAEDHHLWLRCIKWFNFANLPEVLIDYNSNHNPNYDPKYPLLASEAQFKYLKHSGFLKLC